MILIGFALRPVVILLHVLGHAWAAIAFTNQKARIFLGSHGDKSRSADFTIGNIEVWFTVIPLLWQRGLCIPSRKPEKIDHQIEYTLAGPLLPFTIATLALLIVWILDVGEYSKITSYTFFAVTVIDLVVNLIPQSQSIANIEGTPYFNDGYTLQLLLLRKQYPIEYFTAINQFNKHEYAAAARNLEKALRVMPQTEIVYRNLITSYQRDGNFKALKDAYEKFSKRFKMKADDYLDAGAACEKLNDHITASRYYDKARTLTFVQKK